MAHISPLFEDDFATAEEARAAESDLFLSGFSTDINQVLNPPSRTGRSELAPTLAPSAPTPLFNPALLKDVNRTGGVKTTGIPDAPLASVKSLAPLSAGIGAGERAGEFQTTDTTEAAAGIGASVLGGAVSGALVGSAAGGVGAVPGAAIGAISALVISGTKAWFGVRNARKRNRALKELQRKADQQRIENIARDEKWKRINQFNTLQQASENRKQTELQNKWNIYQNIATQMTTLMNSDANLNQILRNQIKGVA